MAGNSIATVGCEDNDSLIRLTQMAFGDVANGPKRADLCS